MSHHCRRLASGTTQGARDIRLAARAVAVAVRTGNVGREGVVTVVAGAIVAVGIVVNVTAHCSYRQCHSRCRYKRSGPTGTSG